MKALSIRQPWAWLIVNGYKDIENRTWNTKFRGRFLIHAGKQFDSDAYQWLHSKVCSLKRTIRFPMIQDFPRGGIVGEVELVDVITESESEWFEGPYGFLLKNPKFIPVVPLAGKLGFFDIAQEAK